MLREHALNLTMPDIFLAGTLHHQALGVIVSFSSILSTMTNHQLPILIALIILMAHDPNPHCMQRASVDHVAVMLNGANKSKRLCRAFLL